MTQITYITSVDGTRTHADIKRSPSGFISAYVPIGRDVSNTYSRIMDEVLESCSESTCSDDSHSSVSKDGCGPSTI